MLMYKNARICMCVKAHVNGALLAPSIVRVWEKEKSFIVGNVGKRAFFFL